MSTNRVRIVISGSTYTIITDSPSEYVENLAADINARIEKKCELGRYISPAQATALTLLEYADEAGKAEKESEKMKAQIQEYLADAAQAKSERDMLKRELAKVKKGGNAND